MKCDLNDILWDFSAMLWDWYAMLWEIDMKGLMIWNAMLWYAIRFEQKRPKTQKSSTHLEVKW